MKVERSFGVSAFQLASNLKPEEEFKLLELSPDRVDYSKDFKLYDDSSRLDRISGSKKKAWIRVLSAVASTEGIEHVLMRGILDSNSLSDSDRVYLLGHQQDEFRHHEMFKGYLQRSFQYRKLKKTWSDRVVYDGFLPKISGWIQAQPRLGYTILYFFELFAIQFYRRVRNSAHADGLSDLVQFIQEVERDEVKHLAGVRTLLRNQFRSKKRGFWSAVLSIREHLAIRLFLRVMMFDVNLSAWAVHNREIRESIILLGINPFELTQCSHRAYRQSVTAFNS